MSNITVTVLAIGQGSASLLEVWEGADYDNRVNHYVALMDCGSDDKKESANVVNSTQMILTAMEKHRTYGAIVPPYLDLLVVSHQDKDHWDKLDMIFKEVAGKRQHKIGEVEVSTCILDPPKILSLTFAPYILTANNAEEYYSVFLSDYCNALYNATHCMVINGKVYNNELNFFYEYFNRDYRESQTLYIEIEDPYFSITMDYQKYPFNSRWEIVMGDDSVTFKYYYVNERGGVYYLVYDESDWRLETKDCQLDEIFKKSLEYLNVTKYGIDISTLCVIMKQYREFLEKISYQKIRDVVDKGYNINQCIGEVLIGGQEDIYSPSFRSMRSRLRALSVTGVVNLVGNQYSNYIYRNKELQLSYEILCCTNYANLGYGGKSPGNSIKHNASSVVLLWSINGSKILFPGDATVHTMFYMLENGLLAAAKNSVIIAPHHGSGTTSKDNTKNLQWEVLKKFFAQIEPTAIIISAGYNNRHGHPNNSFIEKSKEALHLAPQGNKHYIYYNDKDSGNKERKYYYKDLQCKLYTSVSDNPEAPGTSLGYAHYLLDLRDVSIVHTKFTSKLENIGMHVKVRAIKDSKSVDIDQLEFLNYKIGRR